MADYATVAEVKTSLSDAMPSSETQYDSLLAALVTRASRYVDALTGRGLDAYAAPAASTRLYDGKNKPQLLIDEAAELTLVEVSDDGATWSAWNSNDWYVMPYSTPPFWAIAANAMGGYGYFAKGVRNVRVTGRWGYSLTPPDTVKQCTIIQTVRWFKRGQSAFGDAFANADLGGLQFVKGIDPDIQTMVFDAGLRRVAL